MSENRFMLLLTHAYLENIGPEGGIGELEDVVGSDEVKAWLVLVHRVHNGLGGKNWLENYWQERDKYR